MVVEHKPGSRMKNWREEECLLGEETTRRARCVLSCTVMFHHHLSPSPPNTPWLVYVPIETYCQEVNPVSQEGPLSWEQKEGTCHLLFASQESLIPNSYTHYKFFWCLRMLLFQLSTRLGSKELKTFFFLWDTHRPGNNLGVSIQCILNLFLPI